MLRNHDLRQASNDLAMALGRLQAMDPDWSTKRLSDMAQVKGHLAIAQDLLDSLIVDVEGSPAPAFQSSGASGAIRGAK